MLKYKKHIIREHGCIEGFLFSTDFNNINSVPRSHKAYTVSLNHIRTLIKVNKISEAIDEIIQWVENMDDDELLKDITIISANYQQNERQNRANTLRGDEYFQNRSKIIASLLDLLEFIKHVNIDLQNNKLSDDHYFRLLCKLDFASQKQYFNNILKSQKQFIPFVVRAKEGFGQRWLYNRLIHEYSIENPTHPPLILNFNELKMDLDGFLNYLAEGIKVPDYETSLNLDKRKRRLKNSICKRLKSMSQVVVIQDAYSFIHSPDFEIFYQILSYIDEEIEDDPEANHKCIFLFIENTPNPYECEHFICATQTPTRVARKEKAIKFIGLHAIQKLTNQCVETWLDAADDDVCNCFGEANDIDDLIATHDGHPEKIIPAICKKIGIDYEQNINKWLKY